MEFLATMVVVTVALRRRRLICSHSQDPLPLPHERTAWKRHVTDIPSGDPILHGMTVATTVTSINVT
ncbi:MAG: hypothetical protein ACRDHY_01840 [Anaerolineales bacterium]